MGSVILLRPVVKEGGNLHAIRVRYCGFLFTVDAFAGRLCVITGSPGHRIAHRDGHFRRVRFLIASDGDSQANGLARCKSFVICRASDSCQHFFSVEFRFLRGRLLHLFLNRTACPRLA